MSQDNQVTFEEKQRRIVEAMHSFNETGYVSIHELLMDLLVEGLYDKEEGTWTEITDVTQIQTNRNHMNLAQAKYYGLNIIRLGEFIDNSNVKFA